MRLDKFLTEMGAGSRSGVKKLVRSGRVTCNGAVAGAPDLQIDAERDIVCLDQKPVVYKKYEYYLFYKPAGCVTATRDDRQKTVMDYLKDMARTDLFPVGRLDIDTEGLLLITNDGALAHALLSPARHVEKTYYAVLDGAVGVEIVNQFAIGVDIGEKKPTKPAKLVILKCEPQAEIELTITEGKFHQVKRMFAAVGREVLYLRRISMGALRLPPDLLPGEYRGLTSAELAALKGKTEGEGV